MKVVSWISKSRGDDEQSNRLLSYLKQSLPLTIKRLDRIRHHVYLLEAAEGLFILKGFSSHHRLKLQEAFTKSLKKEGFSQSYSFVSFSDKVPLYFDHTFWGCIEYIEPHWEYFSFIKNSDRKLGSKLLNHFHFTTEKFAPRYRSIIPTYSLYDKWSDRLKQFIQNIPTIRYFVNYSIIQELVAWGNWSLAGMKQEASFFEQSKEVILHGDVAHHNFIRAKNRALYLIDFDLISIGPKYYDLLQYANRIFPFLNWSLKELKQYEELKCLTEEKALLYALVFPTDIFREWNRLIREKSYLQQEVLQPVIQLTVTQFELRKKFNHIVYNMVE